MRSASASPVSDRATSGCCYCALPFERAYIVRAYAHTERERKREERGKAKNPLPDSPHLAARRQLVLTQFNKAINAIKTLRSVEERCEQS